jgi:hypothetical protein
MSFSGFGFDYGDMAVHHPLTLLHLSPLLRPSLMMMKKKRKVKKRTTMNRASRRPPRLLFGD